MLALPPCKRSSIPTSSWLPGTLGALLLVLISGCALPPLTDRTDSRAFPQSQTGDTRLGQAIVPETEAHPGLAGLTLLGDPLDAFVARVLLAEAADASLDVQYYIWRPDTSGTLLLHALYRAAERGVRVRLLLDDNGIGGMDGMLAALDRHPNVEVRLYNPFVVRTPKWLGYLTDFRRLNHRMHNKSFTADNQASIIGGRNVADEYFGAGQGALFADLDVLAVGSAVNDVSRQFDRYWASGSAWPARTILSEPDDDALNELARALERQAASDEAQRYIRAVARSELLSHLLAGTLELTWAPVKVVSDDPAKTLGQPDTGAGLISRQLSEALDDPRRQVTLVSPYFIPTETGVTVFQDLQQQGVQVRILTNSLVANDVAAVHAGYAKYRKPLLQAGVELYEMRRLADGGGDGKHHGSVVGSSASSLHAKTFAVDGETLFVGSFNFDPRSVHLNTEMGFVIASPALTRRLERGFDEQVRALAYQVTLDDDGDLVWLERRGDEVIRHQREPETSWLKRTLVSVFAWLPIESLL